MRWVPFDETAAVDSLADTFTGLGAEHGWNGIDGRSEIQSLGTHRLALIEEQVHGKIGLPPSIYADRLDALTTALESCAPSQSFQATHVVPVVATVLAPVAFARLGSLTTPAAVAAGFFGIGLAIVLALMLNPKNAVVPRRIWLVWQRTLVARRQRKAVARRELARSWVKPRLDLLLATYDLEAVRAARAHATSGHTAERREEA
jgi:hypothetical protein